MFRWDFEAGIQVCPESTNPWYLYQSIVQEHLFQLLIIENWKHHTQSHLSPSFNLSGSSLPPPSSYLLIPSLFISHENQQVLNTSSRELQSFNNIREWLCTKPSSAQDYRAGCYSSADEGLFECATFFYVLKLRYICRKSIF